LLVGILALDKGIGLKLTKTIQLDLGAEINHSDKTLGTSSALVI